MKQGAIFDMDGTLVDTEKFYRKGWLEVADDFGYERKPELASAMSGSNAQVMPEILHRFYPDADADAYMAKVKAVVESETAKNLELMPGVVEILEYFKSQNVKMAVASSSFTETVKSNLQRVNVLKYFDVIIGGEQVTNGKPEPDIFIKAANLLKLKPEQCYVFEDSLNGIKAAHAAKSVAIMIPDQTAPTDEIKKICTVYDSLTDAMQAIKSNKI